MHIIGKQASFRKSGTQLTSTCQNVSLLVMWIPPLPSAPISKQHMVLSQVQVCLHCVSALTETDAVGSARVLSALQCVIRFHFIRVSK